MNKGGKFEVLHMLVSFSSRLSRTLDEFVDIVSTEDLPFSKIFLWRKRWSLSMRLPVSCTRLLPYFLWPPLAEEMFWLPIITKRKGTLEKGSVRLLSRSALPFIRI